MASGRRHRTERLARLLEEQRQAPWPYGPMPGHRVSRAARRQLRKLLGRTWGLEYRVFGNTRRRDGSRAVHADALNIEIATRAKTVGHVAAKLRVGQS